MVRRRKEVGIVFCFVQRVGGHHDDRMGHKRGAPGGVTGHKIPLRPPFSTLASRCRGLPVFPYKTCHRPCPFLISLDNSLDPSLEICPEPRTDRSENRLNLTDTSSSRFQRRSNPPFSFFSSFQSKKIIPSRRYFLEEELRGRMDG